MLLRAIKQLASSLLALLYPPLCIHCGEDVSDSGRYLCASCSELLELIDPSPLCPRCFSAKYNKKNLGCADCSARRQLFTRSASAFEYIGPASSLIKKIKYGEMPYLSRGAAAYMAAQFLALNWPLPDLVVPVPLSLAHSFGRGYNQSELLARDFSTLLSLPFCNALQRKRGGVSQAALKGEEREMLDEETFILKEGVDIAEKRLLLIDDVYTTGATLSSSCAALSAGFPSEIYALTLCRAM